MVGTEEELRVKLRALLVYVQRIILQELGAIGRRPLCDPMSLQDQRLLDC